MLGFTKLLFYHFKMAQKGYCSHYNQKEEVYCKAHVAAVPLEVAVLDIYFQNPD